MEDRRDRGVALEGFSAQEVAALVPSLAVAGFGCRAAGEEAAVRLLRVDDAGRWRESLGRPQAPTVVLAHAPERTQLADAMALGASGYLGLAATLGDQRALGDLLCAVLDGQFVCDELLLRSLLQAA